MGDKNNPIKFGPEWLRNLNQTRERNNGRGGHIRPGTRILSQGPGGVTGTTNFTQQGLVSANASSITESTNTTQPTPGTSSGVNRNTMPNPTQKVQLAKMRYGRPEMLALYDRTVEPPEELKRIDSLYQPRPKNPFAFNTSEEDTREGRGAPVALPTERFGAGRGRGILVGDTRGKSRMPFVRSRGVVFRGPEDEAPGRPWSASNGNGNGNPTNRPGGEFDSSGLRTFRSMRTNNTNWRQASRSEGDEWRAQEGPRAIRGSAATDKWGRDWGDRPVPDKAWNSTNRRTWGGEVQNEENLPEWAVDNAEAGAGTFDSLGAFHGYSNDDLNTPKSPEQVHPLTRSHTHGSFSRKPAEEGEDWWVSEKAQKLSPKRFEVADAKFKPSTSTSIEATAGPSSTPGSNTHSQINDMAEKPYDLPCLENTNALMRSDLNFPDTNDERSNFQSVLITPINSLRQKHQNIVTSTEQGSLQGSGTGLLHMLHSLPIPSERQNIETTLLTPNNIAGLLGDITLQDNSINQSDNTRNQIINPNLQTGVPSPATGHIGPTLPISHVQNVGIQNTALNSIRTNAMVMPMQNALSNSLPNALTNTLPNALSNSAPNTLPNALNNNVLPPVLQNSQMNMGNLPYGAVMGGSIMQQNNGILLIPNPNPPNNSLFMNQNTTLLPSNEMNQNNNLFPMLQNQQYNTLYNMMQQQTSNTNAEEWYYEDPKKIIQGPFSAKDMYTWYRAGFFNSTLMVRRACDPSFRPLGSYGPVVPFAQMDVMPHFPMAGFQSRPQGLDMINQRPGLGIEESLWGQPQSNTSQDMTWMHAMNARNNDSVNNLPMYFWDFQPGSAISSNSLLPEEIAKGMKTEDQILAQLRASKELPSNAFLPETVSTSTMTTSEDITLNVRATPDLEKLQKLIPDTLTPATEEKDVEVENQKTAKPETSAVVESVEEPIAPIDKAPSEPKSKPTKESEKLRIKDSGTKSKKKKEDKKEENNETKKEKEEEIKSEKASVESSPSKSKKEEKQSKKDIEKEKKEWIKEGFTIVKAPEKNNKENKKKAEEAKAAEDVERKKKEEEKLAAEEEKRKKIAEVIKKQQDQQQRQIAESLAKKAPWSAQLPGTNKEGLTLAEIQRLEREKKLEQIKEQQQMMQIIAQQHADSMAAEQALMEMQQNQGWAKSKLTSTISPSPSFAAIQAETRRQSAAIAQAQTVPAPVEDTLPVASPQISQAPWKNAQNGGFWETQQSQSKSDKPDQKPEKKKKTIILPPKKETSPVAEFEAWCSSVLSPWSSKIDVPTFVGFLKDIESPYEVKDYVKCYLGESKDAHDFARQFLEKRSKLLRVGTVTPSDDLCSPAIAVNPRASLSDYQEVKGKGKKSKKNKMLKVDARILGFSVTASEDRINVGDIDTV